MTTGTHRRTASALTPLLRAEEVAELLGVAVSTVYEWVRMDYIPHIRLGVGNKRPCVRFDPDQVLAWVRERSRAGRLKRIPE